MALLYHPESQKRITSWGMFGVPQNACTPWFLFRVSLQHGDWLKGGQVSRSEVTQVGSCWHSGDLWLDPNPMSHGTPWAARFSDFMVECCIATFPQEPWVWKWLNMGFSINQPFWDTPIYGHPHFWVCLKMMCSPHFRSLNTLGKSRGNWGTKDTSRWNAKIARLSMMERRWELGGMTTDALVQWSYRRSPLFPSTNLHPSSMGPSMP